VEILRRPFRNGEPAAPLRRAAQSALVRQFREVDAAAELADVLLVISELVQNVSQHTLGDGELVVSAGDGVLVEVGDGDPRPPRLLRPDTHRLGGRGLLVVAAVAAPMTRWRRATPEVVWARLPMRGTAPPGRPALGRHLPAGPGR